MIHHQLEYYVEGQVFNNAEIFKATWTEIDGRLWTEAAHLEMVLVVSSSPGVELPLGARHNKMTCCLLRERSRLDPTLHEHAYRPECYRTLSPMLLQDIHDIDIHSISEPAVLFQKLNVISAHLPLTHPAIFCERPILEAIASLPLHPIVLILVLIPELDGYLVIRESEKLLTQAVRLLFFPFRGQEFDDGLVPAKEAVAVTPDRVFCVRLGDGGRVPWVAGQRWF
jgi:hypothetical protein